MALDTETLESLGSLSQRWSVSKAEVLRRAVRLIREQADAEDRLPDPLKAIDWLQGGGGLSLAEAADFKADIAAERQAKR